MENFASRLRMAMEARGLSQVELARKIGAKPQRLGNWISSRAEHRREPPFALLLKICETLDTHPNYLLGVSDEMSLVYSGDMTRLDMTRLRMLEEEVRELNRKLGRLAKVLLS